MPIKEKDIREVIKIRKPIIVHYHLNNTLSPLIATNGSKVDKYESEMKLKNARVY